MNQPVLERHREGRTRVLSSGYVQIYIGGRWVKEHRWRMEQHLGRRLLRKETVHHKDGDKTNNNIANLELWSSNHPSGQRVQDLLAWAHEILELYDNSVWYTVPTGS